VPCGAANLPGVRQPVTVHEMGKIIQIGDSAGLADALIEVLGQRAQFQRDPEPIRERYLPDTIAIEYEKLFAEISKELSGAA